MGAHSIQREVEHYDWCWERVSRVGASRDKNLRKLVMAAFRRWSVLAADPETKNTNQADQAHVFFIKVSDFLSGLTESEEDHP